MRPDSFGIFWQDVPTSRADKKMARVMPDIPETGWRHPTEFPRLRDAPYISLDIETKDPELLDYGPGWARGKGHIIGVSVGAWGRNWYFPMRHEVMPEHNMDPEMVLEYLRDELGNPNQPKIGANLIYDVGWLEHEGVPVRGMLYDVQMAESLLNEAGDTNLDALGEKYLGIGKVTNALYQWSADYYGGSVNDQRKNLYRCPPCLVGPYAEGDTDLPQRILPLQWEILQREGLVALFEMECRLIPALIAMRRAGVRVDVDKAERTKLNLDERVAIIEKTLKSQLGFEVNHNAPESMKKAFKHLGLTPPTTIRINKKTGEKTNNVSFAKDLLSTIEHPFVDSILEIKKLTKIRDTFIQSYILDSHVDGRVYCEFHPLRSDRGGTRSGRFASSNPNLQNVPSRDEELAPIVRGCFVPNIGHKQWVRYDYSQIEYRGMAHYARGPGSDELRAEYNRDPKTDYHIRAQVMIERILNRKIARKPVKNINFGLIYGMGEGKLMRSLGLTDAEAKEFFEAYHEAMSFAKPTMEHFGNFAMNLGYVTTILGRRSRFDLWEPDEHRRRNDARAVALPYNQAIRTYGTNIKRSHAHKALNRVLQGSAADQMKVAMLKCWDSGVFAYTGMPLLTVHDELDFSDPGGVDDAFEFVQQTMESAIPMNVPIKAEREVGPSWGEAA